jgi:uncharacterized membrane protein YfhO
MLQQPSFDPTRTVILETPPDPPPDPAGAGGAVTLVESSSDRMVLDVDLPSPAILLITDAYSQGWTARSLAPGPRTHYQLLPADYVLRGIPLSAGKHTLAVEFVAPGFEIGRSVSLAATTLLLLTIALRARRAILQPGPRPRPARLGSP